MARYGIALLLAVWTAAVYWGSLRNDFINFDDNLYVTDNPVVKRGLTADGLAWAFTTGHAGNWHPLTWVSHMTDVQLFGLESSGHHGTSLVIHAANGALLFLTLLRMTGALWPSAVTAALFAVHPLHVESVAWASERKDVLSTFFFLLSLWAYAGYVTRASRWQYLLTLGMFLLGLLCKPMLVTLPFLLLLLDFWPLRRFGSSGRGAGNRPPLGALMREKIPFLVLALASTMVTYVVQSRGGATSNVQQFPALLRVGNAFVSYFRYLGNTFWPRNLAPFYPHPLQALPLVQVALGALGVVALTAASVWSASRRPYLFVGWFWYLGSLVPVIGLIQVGGQALADRYTYIPLIGLFMALAWTGAELVRRRASLRVPMCIFAALVLVALSAKTMAQVRLWHDSITIFSHTARVAAPNWMAEMNLGLGYSLLGNHAEAIPHYQEALRLRSHLPDAEGGLGMALTHSGRAEEAVPHFESALRLKPDHVEVHYNFAACLASLGRRREAIEHYEEAIRLRPTYAEAHNNLGVLLAMEGRLEDALAHFTAAVRISPHDAGTLNNLGNINHEMGRKQEAVAYWREALRLDPNHADARRNLEAALAHSPGTQATAGRTSDRRPGAAVR
jgi:tetratricopeptide (TPR) repeat protein